MDGIGEENSSYFLKSIIIMNGIVTKKKKCSRSSMLLGLQCN